MPNHVEELIDVSDLSGHKGDEKTDDKMNNLKCICGNDTFFHYKYEGTYYGKACKKCWKEFLEPISVSRASAMINPWTRASALIDPWRRCCLVSPQMALPEFRRAFPVSPSKKEITLKDVKLLKPGDHVMWQRPYMVWHHAIVIDVPSYSGRKINPKKRRVCIDTSFENIRAGDTIANEADTDYEDQTHCSNPTASNTQEEKAVCDSDRDYTYFTNPMNGLPEKPTESNTLDNNTTEKVCVEEIKNVSNQTTCNELKRKEKSRCRGKVIQTDPNVESGVCQQHVFATRGESNNKGRARKVLRLDIDAANTSRNDATDGMHYRDASSNVVGRKPDHLKVLHWSLSKGSFKIHEKIIDLSAEQGRMFRARYDDQIRKRNPPQLVLARAYALEGSTDYHFFNRNCENFARFCKTGISYNHQFPWLMVKLDETATTSMMSLMKTASMFPNLSVILFAEGIEYSWSFRDEFIGVFFVLVLETISFLIDFGNMYFEFKYPSSCYTLEGEEFRQAVVMRFFEFLFGAAGMISGTLVFGQLANCVGRIIFPGIGTLIGFTIGLVVGTFGGFALGTLGKALGNVIGIFIWCSGYCQKQRDKLEVEPCSPDQYAGPYFSSLGPNTSGAAITNLLWPTEPKNEENSKQRKMRKIYKPSSWEARLGLCVTAFSSILLYAFMKHNQETNQVFRESLLSTAVIKNATYLSAPYPCPAKHVHLYAKFANQSSHNRGKLSHSDACPGWINQSDNKVIGSNTSHLHITGRRSKSELSFRDFNIMNQMFEDENAFGIGNCSYQPYCLTNDSLTVRRTKEYVAKYGTPDNSFPCFHQYYNKSMVIRKLVPEVNYAHKFLWPSLGVFIGLTLVLHAVSRKSQKGENCFVTLTVVLGFRSYFDLFERCWCSL